MRVLENTCHPVDWRWRPPHLPSKDIVPKMCVWHWSDTSTIVQQCQQPAVFQDKADQLFWRSFLTSLMTSPKAQSPLKLSARTPKKTRFLRKSSECSFQLPTMSPVKVCLNMIDWIDWTTWLMIWIPLFHDQIIIQNLLKELQRASPESFTGFLVELSSWAVPAFSFNVACFHYDPFWFHLPSSLKV